MHTSTSKVQEKVSIASGVYIEHVHRATLAETNERWSTKSRTKVVSAVARKSIQKPELRPQLAGGCQHACHFLQSVLLQLVLCA